MALDEQVDAIRNATDALASAAMSKEGVGEAIAQLNSASLAANEAFNKRKDVLTGAEGV
jgi:hypothetical protein